MADAYWEFYSEQSKFLKDRKVNFDEPGGKVRFISDAWKKEKNNAKTIAYMIEVAKKAEERAKAAEERAKAKLVNKFKKLFDDDE